CTGGDISRTAILDNFCWGALDTPEQFGELVKACNACYDTAKIYKTPFISGKDSLNNKYLMENGDTVSITSSLLISAVSVIEDIRKCITMDLKADKNALYLIGVTRDEFPPSVRPKVSYRQMQLLQRAIGKELLLSCHDCSEGGLAVALAEMSFSGGLGAEINLKSIPHEITNGKNGLEIQLLFSETNSRFIAEVSPGNEKEFIRCMKGVRCVRIGHVTREKKFRIKGMKDEILLDADTMSLKDVWQNALVKKL
ncbi:MAG: AIR synthase-related protein, partial [bacterium]|nr:AIR synthase-related protein [bacterium]